MRPIRAAWINDWVGSIGRNPEEEIADELGVFQELLGYEVEVVTQGRGVHILKDANVDLVIFDYGGAAYPYMGGDTPWWQLRELCGWAKEHEGKLVLLYSSFTCKMYETLLKEETRDEIQSENIKPWVDRNFSLLNDQVLQAEVGAWFIGGEFKPYEDPTSPHCHLQVPSRRR